MRIIRTFIALVVILGPLPAAATTVYLTSGTTWTVPTAWNNSNNSIEVIGGGQGGDGPGPDDYSGANGGGGGAYAKTTNLVLTPGATVYISIGAGGAGGNGTPGGSYVAGSAGGDTWFNNVNAAATSTTGGALAKGGSASAGGSAASGVGTVKYSGGNGGSGDVSGSHYFYFGGGGGGAAGLHGAGGAGTGGNSGGAGGAGDSGNTAAGANGTQWDATHGSGGGGAGDASNINAGQNGGLYGAGGGGGSDDGSCGCATAGGNGKQGLIVITYAPPSSPRDITISTSTKVNGNVTVIDSLSKGSGTFMIDDPIDPANKLLYHSFVESSDALNEYAGTTTIGKDGTARVILPNYFEALNGDYNYFVRPIDAPMPNLHIGEEVKHNAFVIAGGVSGGEVSWMVTGVRHDPYILAHPIVPEVEKGPGQLVEKGQYLHAESGPQCSWLGSCLWVRLMGWLK